VPLRPSSLFGRYRAQTGGLGAAVTGNGRNGAVGCNGARCPQIIVLEPLRHRHDLMTRLRQHGFSQREIEVAAAVLRGRNNPTIAKACAIDPATVKVHLRNIYEKVGVHSRAELTARILGFDSGWGWALQRPVTPKKTGPLPL
jgi:DNA-binding CsgD family transcriptional regulator